MWKRSRVCLYNDLRSHDVIKLKSVLEVIVDNKSRLVRRVISGKASNWLTLISIFKYHIDLSPTYFRDPLALRYH